LARFVEVVTEKVYVLQNSPLYCIFHFTVA
jgi:hypothetical protein